MKLIYLRFNVLQIIFNFNFSSSAMKNSAQRGKHLALKKIHVIGYYTPLIVRAVTAFYTPSINYGDVYTILHDTF